MSATEASEQDKLKIISSFLMKSPPGEFNQVLNGIDFGFCVGFSSFNASYLDIRALVKNDMLLQKQTNSILAEYNMDQFAMVDLPGQNYQAVVAKIGQLSTLASGEARFLDPRSSQEFTYNHLKGVCVC